MSNELSAERKAEIEKESEQKLEFVLREYWRLRNGKARFMRCPYCSAGSCSAGSCSAGNMMRKNWPNGKSLCCALFAKAFKAILDRQDRIEAGMRERITEKLLAR